MGSEQDHIRLIAERIARRLSDNESAPESVLGRSFDAKTVDSLESLRAKLSEVQRRLAHLEAHLAHDETCQNSGPEAPGSSRQAGEPTNSFRPPPHSNQRRAEAPTVTRSTWLSGTYVPAVTATAATPPSDERFGIGEAVAEMVDFFESDKTCNLEPGGKPCDHCGMCSARGF